MAWVRSPGLDGLVYEPDPQPARQKKHPCRDCYACQWCSDQRCETCRRRARVRWTGSRVAGAGSRVKSADIPSVNRILKREYHKRYAPIKAFEKVQARDPFRILVSTILSARTKDEMTTVVARRLFKTVKRPADLEKLSRRRLEKLIFPIGFFRTKAKHLKELPRVLNERFEGRIPESIEALCELPGVGRKTANLVMTAAFDKPAICVDVHVHRICNRWGMLETKTPLETEMRLRRILPKRYWKTWNRYLVSFGQTICRPVGPACGECPLHPFCAWGSRAGRQ